MTSRKDNMKYFVMVIAMVLGLGELALADSNPNLRFFKKSIAGFECMDYCIDILQKEFPIDHEYREQEHIECYQNRCGCEVRINATMCFGFAYEDWYNAGKPKY